MGVAEVAAGTFLGSHDDGPVKVFVKSEDTGWAELNADVAAFAPIWMDKYFPARLLLIFAGGKGGSSLDVHDIPLIFYQTMRTEAE